MAFLFLGFSFFLLSFQTTVYIFFAALVCLFGLGYMLSLFNLKGLYIGLAFLLPLSIKAGIGDSGFDLFLPSEIIIALIAVALVFRWTLNGFSDKSFFSHPVSVLLILYLIATGLGVFSSSMQQVSMKAFLVRITYCIVFYFGIYEVFKNNPRSALQLFIAYGIGVFLISLYCLSVQSQFNWDKQTAAYSVFPFYSDHTIYSACAVFILPALFFHYKSLKIKGVYAWFELLGILTILLGIYFTFCRAAWISIFLAFLLWLSLEARFRFRHYFVLFLAGVVLVWINGNDLIYSFKQNRNVSTAPNTTAIEQTQSITNVSTDVSNAERLNRWSCAWRMFLDKPLMGFGPGTFQFQYLSYQLATETTYISVFSPYNAPSGRGGSAHNEYLLLLSESGIFSFLLFVLLILTACFRALTFIFNTKKSLEKGTMIWLLLGFFSYLAHGFFNNFLDTDKAAFLFWTALSFMASLDIVQKKSS
jgi:O-antigen ligase